MPQTLHDDVRAIPLFCDMDEGAFTTLMRGAYVQNFPPQIDMITEGDPADFFHVVLSGSVELFSEWNGRETSMATIRAVSTFILAASLRDAPYLMSARTLEKSRIALIPSQDVRAAFASDLAFSQAIVRELALCYRAVIKNTKDLKLRTSLERLANYLLRQHDRAATGDSFELPTEKRRLASFLGMTPENLSRAFKGLAPYGVEVNGTMITLHDLDDLRAFAKPSALIDDYNS